MRKLNSKHHGPRYYFKKRPAKLVLQTDVSEAENPLNLEQGDITLHDQINEKIETTRIKCQGPYCLFYENGP